MCNKIIVKENKYMKKEYEAPSVCIEEYEVENSLGNLCSGTGPIPGAGGDDIE